MSRLLFTLKRDKIHVDIYHKGEFVCTIKVSDQNRGNFSAISLEASQDTRYKIIKADPPINHLIDESYFNQEIFNK